jgi:hypothetical protein
MNTRKDERVSSLVWPELRRISYINVRKQHYQKEVVRIQAVDQIVNLNAYAIPTANTQKLAMIIPAPK